MVTIITAASLTIMADDTTFSCDRTHLGRTFPNRTFLGRTFPLQPLVESPAFIRETDHAGWLVGQPMGPITLVFSMLPVDFHYHVARWYLTIYIYVLVLNKVLDKLRVDSYYQLIIDNILVLNRIRCQRIIIIS